MNTKDTINFQDLEIHIPDLTVFIGGRRVELSMQQLKLVTILVWEREAKNYELVRRIGLSSESALRTLVATVRAKLDQKYIQTIDNGYALKVQS